MPRNNQQVIANLILYIVDQLNDIGRFPSTIQLVKYIYLIDIEYHRVLNRTLTGLKWIYFHYGPYSFELPALTERLGFDLSREEFSSEEKQGRIFKAEREARFPDALGSSAKSITDRVLKTWGLASTREILDYIYFETEPMLNGKFNEELDFSHVGPDIGAYEIIFRQSPKLEEFKKIFKQSTYKSQRYSQPLSKSPDDLLLKNLDNLESEG